MGAELLGLGLTQASLEDVGHAGEAQLPQGAIEFDEVHAGSPVLCVDEVAVEGELADERVHLAKRQGHGWPLLEVATHEAVVRQVEVEGGLRGVVDRGGAVLPGEGRDAQDVPRPEFAFAVVDVLADRADVGPGRARARKSASVVRGVRSGRSSSLMRW